MTFEEWKRKRQVVFLDAEEEITAKEIYHAALEQAAKGVREIELCCQESDEFTKGFQDAIERASSLIDPWPEEKKVI